MLKGYSFKPKYSRYIHIPLPDDDRPRKAIPDWIQSIVRSTFACKDHIPCFFMVALPDFRRYYPAHVNAPRAHT